MHLIHPMVLKVGIPVLVVLVVEELEYLFFYF